MLLLDTLPALTLSCAAGPRFSPLPVLDDEVVVLELDVVLIPVLALPDPPAPPLPVVLLADVVEPELVLVVSSSQPTTQRSAVSTRGAQLLTRVMTYLASSCPPLPTRTVRGRTAGW